MVKTSENHPRAILQQYFGYSDFRLDQEKIIQSVLDKKDTLVLMPTGGGKSLCYQIPALVLEGLTVVISPLIALMKDQVDALRLNGIKAAFLNSSLTGEERDEIMESVRNNQIKLLYVSPERLLGSEMQLLDFLSGKVSLFAIDEAHCISEWGHDFRPEYMQLSVLRERFKSTPVVALTATAEERTRKDIVVKLGLSNPQIYVSSFNRKNIHYFVEPKQDTYKRLKEYLKSRGEESGIVYCLSRQSVEDLAEKLNKDGFSAKPYHAGLTRDVRTQNQEEFIKDEVKIIVATIAFGMGIDKSNVRFVVHMDLPKNVESYYQETGRAGRDGLKSDAILFYSRGDFAKLKSIIEIPHYEEQNNILIHKLRQMTQFCETNHCRRKYLMQYFGEEFGDHCGTCDVCLTEFEKQDGTAVAQQIIKAVMALKQYYGAQMVIDFLKGADTAKMKDWHKTLPGYGSGENYSKEELRQWIYDLVAKGYLKQEGSPYPVLKVTPLAKKVLEEGEEVHFVRIKHRKEKTSKKEKTYGSDVEVVDEEEDEKPEYDRELFALLRKTRMRIANEEKVPAYIVFGDNTMAELSTYYPQSEEELFSITGFGEVKVKKYGPQIIEVLKAYCQEHGLASRIQDKRPNRKKSKRKY